MASKKRPATYGSTEAGFASAFGITRQQKLIPSIETDEAHETLSKAWHGSEYDLCSISIPKAAAAGPWPRNGVRGGGRRRPHRAASRQSDLVVPLAQRVAAPAATRPLHRPRPDRYGRLRQAARQWPGLVSLRRAPPLPRRSARGPRCARAGHLRRP